MALLARHGIRLDLPDGWEGRIRLSQVDHDDERAMSVTHAANFPLPPMTADYGGGAVEHMTGRDIFVALIEFGPESVGTPLFARRGVPRLEPRMFDPATLQRTLAGQSGTQVFFTSGGRAFCLYVVLGSHLRRHGLVELARSVVEQLELG